MLYFDNRDSSSEFSTSRGLYSNSEEFAGGWPPLTATGPPPSPRHIALTHNGIPARAAAHVHGPACNESECPRRWGDRNGWIEGRIPGMQYVRFKAPVWTGINGWAAATWAVPATFSRACRPNVQTGDLSVGRGVRRSGRTCMWPLRLPIEYSFSGGSRACQSDGRCGGCCARGPGFLARSAWRGVCMTTGTVGLGPSRPKLRLRLPRADRADRRFVPGPGGGSRECALVMVGAAMASGAGLSQASQ